MSTTHAIKSPAPLSGGAAGKLLIESGVPVPSYRRGAFRDVWRDMKAGDSFVVDFKKERNAAYMSGRRQGHDITTEKLDGKGWRVWLVKKAEDGQIQKG